MEEDAAVFVALLQPGGIANEVDGVAEALLGREEDRFAVERGAVPLRNVELGEFDLARFPAPLVFGPAASEIAEQESHDAEVFVDIGVARRELDGLFIDAEGVGDATFPAERRGFVLESDEVVRLLLDSPVEGGDGVVEPPHHAKGVAEVVEGNGELWLELEGPAIRGEGFGVALLIVADHAEVTPGVGLGGLSGEDLLVDLLGFVQAADLLKLPTLAEGLGDGGHGDILMERMQAERDHE